MHVGMLRVKAWEFYPKNTPQSSHKTQANWSRVAKHWVTKTKAPEIYRNRQRRFGDQAFKSQTDRQWLLSSQEV